MPCRRFLSAAIHAPMRATGSVPTTDEARCSADVSCGNPCSNPLKKWASSPNYNVKGGTPTASQGPSEWRDGLLGNSGGSAHHDRPVGQRPGPSLGAFELARLEHRHLSGHEETPGPGDHRGATSPQPFRDAGARRSGKPAWPPESRIKSSR